MDNINLTQRQLDLIKKNQAILSKLPIETYAKVVNTMNDLRINQSKLSDWASYMH